MRRVRGRQTTLNLTGSYRLWLAGDFLLQLKSSGYTQEIQRYAYRDIQALEICHSARGAIYNVVLGSLTVLWLGLMAIGGQGDSRPAFLVGAAFFLGLMVINLVRGPTCHFVLQTALGPQVLPSLSRQRPARRAVALIAERVEAAQAEGGR